MIGIRVLGKEQAPESRAKGHLPKLDFTFADILHNIEELVSELYWAHTGIIYSFPENLSQDQYNEIKQYLDEYLLHEDKARSIQYMHRGFIENFGEYIFSDWVELAGYDDIQKLKTFDPTDYGVIEENAVVYFRCVDGTYWAVYANDEEIINIIDNNFKITERIEL